MHLVTLAQQQFRQIRPVLPRDPGDQCLFCHIRFCLHSFRISPPHGKPQRPPHPALGLPIGYTARLTQNNSATGLYQNQVNPAAGEIHVALMGDPTLRMHPVAPETGLTVAQTPAALN